MLLLQHYYKVAKGKRKKVYCRKVLAQKGQQNIETIVDPATVNIQMRNVEGTGFSKMAEMLTCTELSSKIRKMG